MMLQEWNLALSNFPEPHILQTYEWGKVKSSFGWTPSWVAWYGTPGSIKFGSFENVPISASVFGMSQVLMRSITIPATSKRLKVIYVPKGPIVYDWCDAKLRSKILEDLRIYAAQHGAIFIKIDPDVSLGSGTLAGIETYVDPPGELIIEDLKNHGWQFSKEQVQFRNTILIDLSPSEDQILAQMKQKTRYNVRLAARKGVVIRKGTFEDLGLLYQMYAETSSRDGFVIRTEDYYRVVWDTFMKAGLATPLIAVVSGEPVAAIIIFYFQKKAWYLYGMSRDIERDKMPNYLLQWEAIKLAKSTGCLEYDLWGAPDNFDENDPLWRVYRFKEGLGGQVVRHIGAWDLPIRPMYYKIYTNILPRLLGILRRRAMSRTPQQSSVEL